MNVKEMVFRGEDETKLYACGVCGTCYGKLSVGDTKAREIAENCCAPRYCKECGVETEKYRTMCHPCAERMRLRKATQIEERHWTDPVEFDGIPGGWGDGYFADTDDLREACEDFEIEVPAYCWPCTARPLALSADSLLEHAVDDMHEDAMDEIVDADELVAFVAEWNAKQTCKSWYPDISRVVVLDQERFGVLLSGDNDAG